MALHLLCKEKIAGSTPVRSTNFVRRSHQPDPLSYQPWQSPMVVKGPIFAVVAQLVERHPSKLDVAGSSPVCRTTSINNSMKAIILSLLTLGLAGCYTVPPPPPPPPKVVVVDQNGNPVNPQPTVVVVKPYPVYPEVTWHIGIGLGRGYYRPGPWRHPHRW